MKRSIFALLILLSAVKPVFSDDLQDHARETDALYRPCAGAEDGGFSAIGLSMFGWGVGLAAGVAILAGVLHQSKSAHSH